MMKVCSHAALIAVMATAALADQEASNRPVVRSSQYGIVYARSIPFEDYGQEGFTRVYHVGEDEDTLICDYDWYSPEIYLGGSGDAALVRFGPWHREREPREDHLALGIYRDGEVIVEYSTLELFEMGSGVQSSVSHYRIFGRRLGFSWTGSHEYVFQVEGVSGRVFTFDLDTGEILDAGKVE